VTSEERDEQRAAALKLLGHYVRFAHEVSDSIGYYCALMDPDGMVELIDWSGRFAPHVLVIVPDDRRRRISF
jgi:hypothetical protein